MVNFYRKFICGAALILRPLTDNLGGDSKDFSWSPKWTLPSSPPSLTLVPNLVHLVPYVNISLAVDASDSHVVAFFQQLFLGSWAPLDFYLKKLSSAVSGYSPFDRELLAAYSAVKPFMFLLENRNFILFPNHKPLPFALFRVTPPWSARQQRQLVLPVQVYR